MVIWGLVGNFGFGGGNLGFGRYFGVGGGYFGYGM